jgi:hypothetical protein
MVWDTHRDLAACFAWKRDGLEFPSFDSKLAKERQRVVHVASSRRSCGCEAKDCRFDGVGCGAVEVGPNYPSLDVIFFFAHRGILVFSFPINRTQGLVESQTFNHPSPTP